MDKLNLTSLTINSSFYVNYLQLDSLAEVVKRNTSLTKISLGSFTTRLSLYQNLIDALAESSSLQSIYLDAGLRVSEEQEKLIDKYNTNTHLHFYKLVKTIYSRLSSSSSSQRYMEC